MQCSNVKSSSVHFNGFSHIRIGIEVLLFWSSMRQFHKSLEICPTETERSAQFKPPLKYLDNKSMDRTGQPHVKMS